MGQIMMNGRDYSGAKIVELTQAEYDALPESKENDGIEYFIIDSDGDMPYVIANPTDSATTPLNKIYIDGVVYYIPQGSAVIPNPSGTPSTNLESLEIDGTVYGIPEGTEVIANPSGTATDELTKLGVDGTIYELGGGTEVIANPTGTPTDDLETVSIDGDIFSVGGGNANEQVLTWAEYCALTPEEKMNGTTYYITDVNGDGSDFQPVIYSEDEREIGVWTDGRPLYEKTYTVNLEVNNSNWTSTGIEVGDIDKAISVVAGNNVGTCWNALFCAVDQTYIRLTSPRNGDTISVNWFTLRYTKTTDQPGSGTWTPQGVPAVHYDGNEKVVGTWIDGSTLYERTLYKDLSGQAEHWYVYLDTLIDDINDYTIINFQGQLQFKEGSYIYSHIVPNYIGGSSYYYINRNSGRWYLYFHSGNATCDWGYATATIRYVKKILGEPTS